MKNSNRLFAIFVLLVTIATNPVLAHAIVSTKNAKPFFKNGSISTDIQMTESSFAARIKFRLSQSKSIQSVKSLFKDTQLMGQLNSWVKGAKYSVKDAYGRYALALTLGKYGHYYTIPYGCTEQQTPSSWDQTCKQIYDTKIMNNGFEEISCKTSANNSTGQGVACEMDVAGQAKSIGSWIFKYSGPTVAYKYYTEMTSYVTKIALLTSKVAKDAGEANVIMKKSNQLQEMMSDLATKARMASGLSANQTLTASAVCPDSKLAQDNDKRANETQVAFNDVSPASP